MFESSIKNVSWDTFKALQASEGLAIWEIARDQFLSEEESPGGYELFLYNQVKVFRCFVSSLDVRTEYTEEEGLQSKYAVTVSSEDEMWAQVAPPLRNSAGANIVEIGDRVGQKGNTGLTIVSHDYSDPTTWYQNSTAVPEEELSDLGDGLWGSANTLWVNEDHPNLIAPELWDKAESKYRCLYQKDGTRFFRGHFRPVVEVQPGGAGDWVVASADDPTVTPSPNYGHRIGFVLGQLKFLSVGDWLPGTKVRASYFFATETAEGSVFEIAPPAGKRWILAPTECQLTVGARWRDTVMLDGCQGGFPGSRTTYRTYSNMQSTAVSPGWEVDGMTETPHPWAPSAETGWHWPVDLYDGMRNNTKKLAVVPWDYKLAYDLNSSLAQSIKVYLRSGLKFLDADLANFAYYIEEVNE